ncbi:hypothetical protein FRN30_22915 [Vibrio alginolyticus]|nr:hypothetical protein [Vibrio alginolyticus]ELB2885877.1 hypothetical protein [Vibrio alginolyticus]ELN6939269.1 hypothetical protein [Vibrio alginolyticus]
MMKKDILDKTLDLISKKTAWLYEQDLLKNWFNILSWTTLTGFIFVMYKHSESYLLLLVGSISFVLVFSYAWHTMFDLIQRLYGKAERNSVSIFAIAVAAAMPSIFLFYMIKAINFVIESGT